MSTYENGIVLKQELFNCCTDCKEPDWSQFDALEIDGCIDDGEGNTTPGYHRDLAEFFTVYGHLKVGGAEALGDFDTLDGATAAAAEMSTMSGGLPVNTFC
jgi:hypothetical protein